MRRVSFFRSSRFKALSIGLWLGFGIFLSQCSLSIENPQLDAQKKLAKVLPTTLALLEGRWQADSTFTVEDTRATDMGAATRVEIFADTTLSALDTTRLAFNGSVRGAFTLSKDTLFLHAPGNPVDTFIVKLRFLGNWLELDHPADERFSYFHRLKPPDSNAVDTIFNPDSLWRLQGRRQSPDFFQPESLVRNFFYLRFRNDSIFHDVHENGVFHDDSGALKKDGRTWTWAFASGNRTFLADPLSHDSLRLWPLVDGRPDSGFDLYIKVTARSRYDIDMRPFFGHLRTDSIRQPDRFIENHFGRFYDLILGEDHRVTLQTNMPTLPAFTDWMLDSGMLKMDWPRGSDKIRTRFRIDTLGEGKVKLAADSGSTFSEAVTFYQTRVDGSRFEAHPLERFPFGSYVYVTLGQDTLPYYFNANWVRAVPEHFEISAGDTSQWLIFNVDPALESFQSSQIGFKFAFQGRDQAHGQFTCRSAPDKDLALRLTASTDPLMEDGLLQGTCVVIASEKAGADTTLTLDGTFRFRRKTPTGLRSPLWNP